MKPLVTAVLVLSLTATPVCAQVVVVVEKFHPSSQNPRITVVANGKPQPRAELNVSGVDKKQKLSITTDSGRATSLPHLAPGRYCIVASTSPTFRADLCIQIVRDHQSRPSEFAMELAAQPPPPPTLEERLETAEKAPPDLRVRGFVGTVCDPTGGVIQHASVAVYHHGMHDTAHAKHTTTDQRGHFSIHLNPGKCTAVIQSPGFETRILTFEVSADAAEQELSVKLNVGAVSETVAIARKGSER